MNSGTKLRQGFLQAVCILAALGAVVAAFGIGFCLFRVALTPEPAEPTLPPPAANPYSPADFAWEDGRMVCLTGQTLTGIDVSQWQSRVDWPQVKAAGIDFVMIRVSWRGSTEGGIYIDEMAQSHYEGAKAAGLKIGAYAFSQARSPREAEEEANFLLEQIRSWQLDMPLVFDWESTGSPSRVDGVTRDTVTQCAIAFCEKVKQAGYTPMVYFNSFQATRNFNLPELTDYPFWLAQYADTMEFPYQVEMWQYTQEGKVPGIDQDVDLNLLFLP